MENRQRIKELFHGALELPQSEWANFLAANCFNEATCREVENLLQLHEQAGNFMETPALVELGAVEPGGDPETDERLGEKIGPYEIIKEIGRGGMGAVYLAHRVDDEFNQLVALKIIKRGMDTDFILKRFRNERQILAGLNHPNIARLLEGGTTPDGLPFFAMEYVDGQHLISFCRRENLNLEPRLNLFREICSAVAHAHQNLIVHRDLKPSNILVTQEGVPKLLDFGIAKLVNQDSDYTKTTGVMRLLTPEYASPEQIRGEQITTASDVYSLGVILYELLTGQSPYDTKNKGINHLIQAVCENEPSVPSNARLDAETQRHGDAETQKDFEKGRKGKRKKVDEKNSISPSPLLPFPLSQLRGDLDNIVLKALQKEPSRRYQSVQEFSEDVRRYLYGLPVTAQADTFIYRATKFFQRHRAGVLAGLFMFLSLIAGISVATWQALEARRERARAEQRFNEVRKLANSFLFEFHDAIKNLPGSTPARKMVIERALPFLDNLSQEAAGDDSLQSELAESYKQLGQIQGSPAVSNLGDTQGGIESLRKSIKIGEDLVRRHPTHFEYRFNLVGYYNMLGDMFNEGTYDLPNALENYQLGLRLSEELRNESPDDPKRLRILMFSYERVGLIKFKMGDLNAALKNLQTSLALIEKVVALQPTETSYQRNLAISYFQIGRLLKADGKYREALEYFAKARHAMEGLIASNPNNTEFQRVLAILEDRAANCHSQLGEMEMATALSDKALASREKLLAGDSTNFLFYGDVTVSLDTAGDLRVKAGDPAGALKLLHRSLEMRETALKERPALTLAKHYIGVSRSKIADALRAQNDLAAALKQQQQALQIYRELLQNDPQNLEIRRQLAELLQQTGETLTLLAVQERRPGKWEEARVLFDESLTIYNDMKAKNQSFGPDSEKINSINAFVEKHKQHFTP